MLTKRAWCEPALSLHEGGFINSANFPKSRVISVEPLEETNDASAVVIRLDEGGTFSALVPNHGEGQNIEFRSD